MLILSSSQEHNEEEDVPATKIFGDMQLLNIEEETKEPQNLG